MMMTTKATAYEEVTESYNIHKRIKDRILRRKEVKSIHKTI
jgi:hypothetical protein